jgi:hypothetical protein
MDDDMKGVVVLTMSVAAEWGVVVAEVIVGAGAVTTAEQGVVDAVMAAEQGVVDAVMAAEQGGCGCSDGG